MCVYIYIYIYIEERERERQRDRDGQRGGGGGGSRGEKKGGKGDLITAIDTYPGLDQLLRPVLVAVLGCLK
jgi:hypothetical protein